MYRSVICVGSLLAASAFEQECGIGTYDCTGTGYTTAGFADLSGGGEVNVVEVLEGKGWWRTTITAQPNFTEVEYCTNVPSNHGAEHLSAGSDLLCVTTSRNDQINPDVFIYLHMTDCNSYTKIITAAPATSTSCTGGVSDPFIGRVTCHRRPDVSPGLAAVRDTRRHVEFSQQVQVTSATCGRASYECRGDGWTDVDGSVTHLDPLNTDEVDVITALDHPGWFNQSEKALGGGFQEFKFCTPSPDARDRSSLAAGSDLICAAAQHNQIIDPDVTAEYHQMDCSSFSKVIRTGPGISRTDGAMTKPFIGKVFCEATGSSPQFSMVQKKQERIVERRADYIDPTCGIGTYDCEGDAYESNDNLAEGGFWKNLTGDEVNVVEALPHEGWWQYNITAGGGSFFERELCTQTASAGDRTRLSPGSDLLCVTAERNDQVNPDVVIRLHQTDCDHYTKIIFAAPSPTSADQDVKTAPFLGRVTCTRQPQCPRPRPH